MISLPLVALSQLIREHRSAKMGRVCLLLGAGADISSGGMTFFGFKQAFLGRILGKPIVAMDEIQLTSEVDTYFANFVNHLAIRKRLFSAAIELQRHRQPSEAYKLLALCLEQQVIDALITTNFDTMLEDAERDLGLSTVQVFAKGVALGDPDGDTVPLPGRTPYIKLHGCLRGKTVTHITSEELNRKNSYRDFQRLLEQYLPDSQLILIGYSGYDVELARVLAKTLGRRRAKVYWCNPQEPRSDSPLFKAIGADRVVYVRSTFDELVDAIGNELLSKPTSTGASKPLFISRLLEWRLAYANGEYVTAQNGRARDKSIEHLARRRAAESELRGFLSADRPLCFIVGPSGTGKSFLGLRLLRIVNSMKPVRVLLLRAQSLRGWNDFTDALAAQLGGLGPSGPFNFIEFGKWLRSQELQLVIYIDGLNEFSSEFGEIAALFRDIVRFCYFQPTPATVKLVISVRQETWRELLRHEDVSRLSTIAWNPRNSSESVLPVQMGPLAEDEIEELLGQFCECHGRENVFGQLPPQAVSRLSDPFLLGGILDHLSDNGEIDSFNWVNSSASRIYEDLLERRLAAAQPHGAGLAHLLAQVAGIMLSRKEYQVREVDIVSEARILGLIHSWEPSAENIMRLMIDLGMLAVAEHGQYRFAHERLFEIFLARALEANTNLPNLEIMTNLARALEAFDQRPPIIAAIRRYFLTESASRFDLLRASVISPQRNSDAHAQERIFAFAKEILVELACELPDDFIDHMAAVQAMFESLGTSGSNAGAERYWRAVIQAASHLPDILAIRMLTRASVTKTELARTEAEIYAIDRIARHITTFGIPDRLLADPAFGEFFRAPQVPRLRRLWRVLCLVAEFGPDNTPLVFLEPLHVAAMGAVDSIMNEGAVSIREADSLAAFLLKQCDRYLFNAKRKAVRRFFLNDNRRRFLPLLAHLESGGILRPPDVAALRPYLGSFEYPLEFQLGNFFFILSAANGFLQTKEIWETCFETFDDHTAPQEVDFFQAVVPYLYIVNGRAYDDLLETHIDRILRDCPTIVEYEPGRHRGSERGYTNEFSQIFEDGFNPLSSYLLLIPAAKRIQYWPAHLRSPTSQPSDFPVFMRHLSEALHARQTRKALRLIHAIGQFTMLWPEDGLPLLVDAAASSDSLIRQGVVRVLAETFNRHPSATLRFIAQSGIMLSQNDLRDIRARIDPQTGRRQVEITNWGRILYFMTRGPGARAKLFKILRRAYEARSLREVTRQICEELFGTLAK